MNKLYRVTHFFFLGLVCLGLGACGSQGAKVFDPAMASDIKTVIVLAPNDEIGIGFSAANAFQANTGIAGAVAESIKLGGSVKAVQKIIREANDDYSKHFAQVLANELTKQGYEAEVRVVKRQMYDGKPRRWMFLDDYENLRGDSDAIVDGFFISYGYMAEGLGSGDYFKPFLMASMSLVKNNAEESLLFADSICVNPPQNSCMESLSVAAPAGYAFKNLSAMEKEPKRTADGFREAIELAAKAVAKALRK